MSDSNRSGPPATGLRNLIFAAAALIIAGAISLGFYYQAKYENASRYRAADYAADAEKQIGQTCFGIPVAQQPACLKKAATEARLKERDNQHNETDLVAQQTSALWTSIMGIAAVIGMALSVVGVYLVWTTFHETKRTNRISMMENARSTRRAVAAGAETKAAMEIAERNAKAATALVTVSQDNAQKGLRAYLDFDGVHFAKREKSPKGPGWVRTGIAVCLKNYGRTPAREVNATLTFLILDPEGKPQKQGEESRAFVVVSPNDHATSNTFFDLTNAMWTDIKLQKIVVQCGIEVTYADVFGGDQSMGATFESFGGDKPFGVVFATRHAT